MAHKHKVQFTAHKIVEEPVRVSFPTREGQHVSFGAHRPVKEEVEVKFYAKN